MMNCPLRFNLRPLGRWLAAGALCLAAGCATGPRSGRQEVIFFPPAPNEPRIQFLTGFGSEADLAAQSKFAEFVVGEERIQRPIWKPYGIAVTRDKVYVTDTQPCNVGIIDLVRRKIRYLRPQGPAAMQMPINVAVDAAGIRYVTDTKRCQVLIYSEEGNLLGEIGRNYDMKPCGIALTADRLIVTDLSNRCVRVYDKASRDLLFTVPRDPKNEKARLYQPTNVAVDGQGRIYVADTAGFYVQVYDAEGNHLRSIGEMGLEAGRFALPKGIAVDREGRVYVVDAATAVVQIFDAEGRLLMHFGEPKTSGRAALYLPTTVAIDYENIALFQKYVAPGFSLAHLIFVVNQAGPNKIAVYGFLRKT